jgi:hypothetical protein
MRFLLLLKLVPLSWWAPGGFVDEGIAEIEAIPGVFAPNPRTNNGKPMLILSAKEGNKIHIMEDPNYSNDFIEIADIGDRMCVNGERRLQSVHPHPNFAENRFIYLYFMQHHNGCRQSATEGPQSRLSRFIMDPSTLEIHI